MPEFDWKALVRTIAPALGSALGGPLAGTAIRVLAETVLGRPDAPADEVADALRAGTLTPEQIVALRSADEQFKLRMRELDIDVLKLNQAADAAELEDMQSARRAAVDSGQADTLMRLGLVILCAFGLVMLCVLVGSFAMMTGRWQPTSGEYVAIASGLVGTVVGQVSAAALTVVAFYFGSSRSSRESGQAVQAALQDAIRQRPADRSPEVRAERVTINQPGAAASNRLPAIAPARPDPLDLPNSGA